MRCAKALGDGGLTDARLPDQGRVVLGAPGKNLHQAADFLVAPDDRVQLSLACQGGQVAPVFLQGLVSAFGVFTGDALRATDGLEGVQNGILCQTVLRQAFTLARIDQPEQDMFHGNIVILHPFGVVLGSIQHIDRGLRQADVHV